MVLTTSEATEDVLAAHQAPANAYFVMPPETTGWEAMLQRVVDYWCAAKVATAV